MVYFFSIAAALMFSFAAIMQHREARLAPQSTSLKLALILKLLKRPIWITGMAFDAIAFLAQFLALKFGSILLVQPILAFGLTFTILFEMFVSNRRFALRTFLMAIVSVLLVVLFLSTTVIPPGGSRVTPKDGVIVTALDLISFVVIRLIFAKLPPAVRGVSIGTIIGVLHGSAVFVTKAATIVLLRHGFLGLLVSWPIYSLALIAVLDIVVTQSAFQVTRLTETLPIINVAEPTVAMVLGAVMLHESLRSVFGNVFLASLFLAMAVSAILVSLWALHMGDRHDGEKSSSR